MRRTLTAALVVLLGLVFRVGAAEDAPQRHTEKAGGYSFVPPKGWKMMEFGGLKHKIAVGPAANGFAPNIVFVDEAFKGNLIDYVAGSKDGLKKAFKKFKEISETSLKTKDGAACVRFVIERDENGKQLRQSFYFFDLSPGRKLVVTCTALTDGGEKLDPAFEESMKTFRLEKT
jgi:hypothetical protein